MSIRIVFMGSPDFSLPSLSALAKAYQMVGVVTQPDRSSGRGRELKSPPVKKLALELTIPIMQPEKLRMPDAVSQLQEWRPDLIIVAAFGQILKREVLELPRYGCINVHASLLPRWRGAAPVNAAILAGDEQTGVTIMQMDVGMDTGPMLARRAVRIKPDDTTGSVLLTLSTLGADLLLKTLPDYISGKLTSQPQPPEGVTYAPMLKKEDGLLDFTHPAIELERRVRAMNPWPGAWFEWNGNPLKVTKASVGNGEKSQSIGSRLKIGGRPAVMS
ncbi:MAG TPA: methionyl-tRNA formyltransferase, partial [Anaerolineales bacterium]|nr:methionyl-tRNA formyltransferase [Anaerolineales bacterium]